MAKIHPTAVVDPKAEISDTAEIGPYSFIGPNVRLGANVKVYPYVYITGQTTIGDDCVFFPHSTIGSKGQILGLKDGDYRLEIGARNVFRESVTIHGAAPTKSEPTRIGNDGYFMIGIHVAHDCQIGDKCVFANLTTLGGETHVGDQVWFGGSAFAHQKTWVGDHAFIGGGSIVVGDVLPYAMTQGNHAYMASVNVVGLKRRGFSKSDIREIHRSFKVLGEKGETFQNRLSELKEVTTDGSLGHKIYEFASHPRGGRALCQFRSDR